MVHVVDHVADHVTVHRTPYIYFILLLYRVQMPLSTTIFNRILDVMLQLISSPPSEARSPPPARRTTAKKAVTYPALQLHAPSKDCLLPYFQAGQAEEEDKLAAREACGGSSEFQGTCPGSVHWWSMWSSGGVCGVAG
jgi:hypothetical protein